MTVGSGPIRAKRVLPGLALSLSKTFLFMAQIVLTPVAALILKGAEIRPQRFLDTVTSPWALSAFRVTRTAAAITTLINAIYGLQITWELVRYDLPGRRLLDALMDAPFDLPTAMAGLALTALFSSNGWFGPAFDAEDFPIVYTIWGIARAMAFSSVPFVVRTGQPVLEDMDPALEQAALTLCERPWSNFTPIVFPAILPAWLAECTTALARSLGEFGAIVFIAGNLPMKTEIATLLAYIHLEEYDYNSAAAIARVLLAFALILLGVSNMLQSQAARHREGRG